MYYFNVSTEINELINRLIKAVLTKTTIIFGAKGKYGYLFLNKWLLMINYILHCIV